MMTVFIVMFVLSGFWWLLMYVLAKTVEEYKRKKEQQNTEHPDYNKLRPVIFWDTKMKKINWQKQQTAVIKRVFERGNELEKKEITRFYGKEAVQEALCPH